MSHSVFKTNFRLVADLVFELRLKNGTVFRVKAISIALLRDEEISTFIVWRVMGDPNSGSLASSRLRMSLDISNPRFSAVDLALLNCDLVKSCFVNSCVLEYIFNNFSFNEVFVLDLASTTLYLNELSLFISRSNSTILHLL